MRYWIAIAAFCSAMLLTLASIDLKGGVTMANAIGGEHASRVNYPDAVLTATDQASGIKVSVGRYR